MSIGIPEIILILVVVLLIFGGKRIPELARSLGRAKHEYQKAKDAIEKEAKDLEKTIDAAASKADASENAANAPADKPEDK
ncbi:twin-arginine translocase TatA/TatE family subunit [Fibrobacter sp.]|uniref:twin-arginine translocase TatA/TatE family subunit n=1 Tax=Fibrobacter sp. TaxID=35828 RepID=UPI00388EF26F